MNTLQALPDWTISEIDERPSYIRRNISPSRRSMHNWGLGLGGFGVFLFGGCLVVGVAGVGGGFIAIALLGLVLCVAGGFLRNVGAKGWAGSGIVLDPEQARRDLEPWSRMRGGMLNDLLSEVTLLSNSRLLQSAPVTIIKVRCRECESLHDEDARYCNQCGNAM